MRYVGNLDVWVNDLGDVNNSGISVAKIEITPGRIHYTTSRHRSVASRAQADVAAIRRLKADTA